MTALQRILLGFAAVATLAFGAPATTATADASFWMQGVQSEVRVISPYTATGENEATVPLGLEFKMNEGWHIYWRTPGEAGLPPQLDYGQSLNIQDVSFSWPVPVRDVQFGIETFIYKDTVVLPFDVTLQQPGQPLDLRGRVDFLICEEVCIPDTVDVAFSLPGGPARVAANEAALLNTFETRIPSENGGSVGLTVESIAFEPTTDPEKPALIGHLVTNVSSVFEMTKPDVFAEVPDGYFVRKPTVSLADDAMTGSLRSRFFGRIGPRQNRPMPHSTITVADGIRGVELTPFRLLDGFGTGAKALAATPDALDLSLPTLLGMLVLAVIGGFILNFMPCVLPVLSLKMFSVVSHGGQADRKIRLSFAATAAGVLVSFLILALIFASLKLAGASFGWGVQFTQPIFILALLVVLLGFALNLFACSRFQTFPALAGWGQISVGSWGTLPLASSQPCSQPRAPPPSLAQRSALRSPHR